MSFSYLNEQWEVNGLIVPGYGVGPGNPQDFFQNFVWELLSFIVNPIQESRQ